jgi:pSer/pThr/pTyr-binding forkhead associated (FHA) protein
VNPNPPRREATFLETDDDIRAALAARQAAMRAAPPRPAAPAARLTPDPTAPAAAQVQKAAKAVSDWPEPAGQVEQYEPQPFRPTNRPPIGMICVLDDQGDNGAWHRLLKDRTVIGRSEGDILIPHDGMISTRHAELIRQQNRGSWRWILNDLGSTNGTYVRVSSGILRHEQEFLIGRTRYRFDAAKGDGTLPDESPKAGGTVSWQESGALAVIPSVVELTPRGEGSRIPITTGEIWIGRDPNCQVVVSKEDPFANARHARIYRDGKGRWFIENNRSLNGVWIRVEQMPLDAGCQFLLGEQRFKMQVAPS